MSSPKNNDSPVVIPSVGLKGSATNEGGNTSPGIRNKMKQFWEVYPPSIESMMLSHDAPQLSVEEQKEIMDYLPQVSYAGKKVLELGAGIGRYTSLLSDAGAGHVTAVDFMESYTKENQRINGHRENVTMLCADVTKLIFKPQSFDLVFSNWLLMFLTDSEVESFLQRVLAWLKPGGYLFIRESCYNQAGNLKRNDNPSLYRSPLDYASTICSVRAEAARFKLIKAKSIQTYIRHYGNPNQLCFVVRQESDSSVAPSGGQNTRTSEATDTELQRIALREAICGKTWCSEGGRDVAQVLMSRLGSMSDRTVLDASCGSAGLAFILAQQGATRVHGLASITELLHFALRHHRASDPDTLKKTSFEYCPSSERTSSDKFDVVCANTATAPSADTFTHYRSLLSKGGLLQLATYTAPAGAGSTGVACSTTLQSMATAAGFTSITLQQCPAMLLALTQQLGTLQAALRDKNNKQLADYPPTLLEDYLADLTKKVTQLRDGRLTWTIVQATV